MINDRKKIEAFYLLMNTPPILNVNSVIKLLKEISVPQNLWYLNDKKIRQLCIPEKDKEKLINKLSETSLEEQLSILNKADCNVVVYSDENYPDRLKRYLYQPLMLFYKGDVKLLNSVRMIAIVGTRKASQYGKQLVESFVADISLHGYPVITGTAKGIDTEVIINALKHNLKCVSVLASGIDQVSPKQSKVLIEEIIKAGGCCVTEFPPGTSSFKSNYNIRAKIIAVLSSEAIIIEAPNKSGALHVAEESFKVCHEVFCPPSYYYDSNFWGSHNLIDSGKAKLVQCFKDI